MRKWKSIFNEDLTCINEKKVTNNFYDKSISNLLDPKNYGFYENKNKRQLIFEKFIYGDIHSNKKGNLKILNEIINRIRF